MLPKKIIHTMLKYIFVHILVLYTSNIYINKHPLAIAYNCDKMAEKLF